MQTGVRVEVEVGAVGVGLLAGVGVRAGVGKILSVPIPDRSRILSMFYQQTIILVEQILILRKQRK